MTIEPYTLPCPAWAGWTPATWIAQRKGETIFVAHGASRIDREPRKKGKTMSNRPTIAQELMAALAENDALKKQLAAAGHTPAATAATAAPDCSGLTEDQQRVKLAETKVQIAALNAKRDELLAEKAKDEAKIAAMKATLAAISASAPTTPEQARAQYEALPPGDRKAFRARFWNLLGCDRE